MSLFERLITFFKELDCRTQTMVSESIKNELDCSVHYEVRPAESLEKKKLTIEDVDTDNSDDDVAIFEDHYIEAPESVENNVNNEELEFQCDERELIKKIEEEEKENVDEDRKRFSMC